MKTSFGTGKVLAIIVILTLVLTACSAEVEPVKNEKGEAIVGCIAEKTFVEINGVRQGMIIKGASEKNPVVLFVHGGPAMPEYMLARKYCGLLEQKFTVCYWDQRGGGLSYYDAKPEDITLEQYEQDMIGVTNYLRERFGQEKIIAVAHSWGTYIAINTVKKAPELYSAYVAVAQMSDRAEEKRVATEYVANHLESEGNAKEAGKVRKRFMDDDMYRDSVLHKMGTGTMRDMKSVVTGAFFASFAVREYTPMENINLWRGRVKVNKLIHAATITDSVKELNVPFYVMAGVYDYTIPLQTQKQFFDGVSAPVKGFYTFAESAHSPIFEEREKFVNIMETDVVNGKTDKADK